MSAALVNRSLSTVKTELEFLRESNVITEDFFQQVMTSLPDRYQNGNAPVGLQGQNSPQASSEKQEHQQHQHQPPQPPQQRKDSNSGEFVEALYPYSAQQPEDLALRVGDKVEVLEHTSPDWWKGSSNGKVGMFPSNYVKPLSNERQNAPSPAPSYQAAIAPQQQQYNNGYPQYPNNGNPFPPQQQQVQPQEQQPQQAQGQQNHGSGAFKKFGSKLGNAAIFGAGATIGSDIVNSIF